MCVCVHVCVCVFACVCVCLHVCVCVCVCVFSTQEGNRVFASRPLVGIARLCVHPATAVVSLISMNYVGVAPVWKMSNAIMHFDLQPQPPPPCPADQTEWCLPAFTFRTPWRSAASHSGSGSTLCWNWPKSTWKGHGPTGKSVYRARVLCFLSFPFRHLCNWYRLEQNEAQSARAESARKVVD